MGMMGIADDIDWAKIRKALKANFGWLRETDVEDIVVVAYLNCEKRIKKFDPTDLDLVGRRCTWNIYGVQYTGTIVRVVANAEAFHEPGDWIVEVDGGGIGGVIGQEEKLLVD